VNPLNSKQLIVQFGSNALMTVGTPVKLKFNQIGRKDCEGKYLTNFIESKINGPD